MDFWMETARLGFSRWRPGDVHLAKRLWGNRSVTRYISRTGEFTDEEVASRLQAEIDNHLTHGLQYWPIFQKDSNTFVGCCGLRPYQGVGDCAELGAHLLPEYWRQGLAAEASRAVIDHAFRRLGLRTLVAGHHPENKASERALLRLGFVRVGGEYYPPTGLEHPSYKITRTD
ncbi:MAG: GNAT family N-acetyltransferase [Bacillota bacterium]|jgi:ribosomal-protein-alanine N-acetyltransferase